ncbi:MAG TPA: carboxymuconolactone decarboxylase family protein [Candidatus Babeliales bacterium]|nr:carboxymuconolactone decarboxylase family protein [Candidatus Babeliales bacterium]
MENDKNKRGMQRFQEILGQDALATISRFQKISPDFANYIINFGYAELYSRGVLSDKSLEIIAVSSLISQGNFGTALKAHIGGMLNVGWTEQEIMEVIVVLIGYVGFPTTVEAIKVAHEVFETRKTLR